MTIEIIRAILRFSEISVECPVHSWGLSLSKLTTGLIPWYLSTYVGGYCSYLEKVTQSVRATSVPVKSNFKKKCLKNEKKYSNNDDHISLETQSCSKRPFNSKKPKINNFLSFVLTNLVVQTMDYGRKVAKFLILCNPNSNPNPK